MINNKNHPEKIDKSQHSSARKCEYAHKAGLSECKTP